MIQNVYVKKFIKNYEIDVFLKFSKTPISVKKIKPYKNEIDDNRLQLYRRKIESICYPAAVIKFDIIKAVFKLTESLINSGPHHMTAINHCLKYLNAIKH